MVFNGSLKEQKWAKNQKNGHLMAIGNLNRQKMAEKKVKNVAKKWIRCAKRRKMDI